MTNHFKTIVVVLVLLIFTALFFGIQLRDGKGIVTENPPPTIPPESGEVVEVIGKDGLVEIGLTVSGVVSGVTITPREIVEDSRCPIDVQCIQAGTVRVRAAVVGSTKTAEHVFLLGEPIETGAERVTLVEVRPSKKSTLSIEDAEYRFVFKVEKSAVTYINASVDMIVIDTPHVGAVVGKEFFVRGTARGGWFFEASFPIVVKDANGKVLTTVVAQAEGEWMTENFVPFTAKVVVPQTYSGPATLVAQKDNPSGMPENAASAAFPVTIEY